jgi:ElaB/YqjD/DUF883 family membrane-anchored ribosome-binding protein
MEHQIPVTSMDQEKPETKPSSQPELPEQIREISDMVCSTLRDFKESQAYDKLLEGRDTAREYIRQNPLASLGYALGAGVLFGFILKRTR